MPLHPQAKAFIAQVEAAGRPSWSEMPVAESRRVFAELREIFGEPLPIARVYDVEHPNGFGMRVYHPNPESRLPVAVYFHGGGWVLGDRETHDSLCRHLAAKGDCVVVSVDYRRAPEHAFPVPFHDCCNAILHLVANQHEMMLDSDRIAVGGDSAGGNLAAAVALRFRDDDGPTLRGQLLVYPVLGQDFQTDSYSDFAEGYGLTRDTMRWFWQQYLGASDLSEDPLAAPAQAENLTRLPTTHVMTAEYDVLRDEGEHFAQRLQAAGVETTMTRYDGMLHGFVHLSSVFDDGVDARDEAAEFLRKVLA